MCAIFSALVLFYFFLFVFLFHLKSKDTSICLHVSMIGVMSYLKNILGNIPDIKILIEKKLNLVLRFTMQ